MDNKLSTKEMIRIEIGSRRRSLHASFVAARSKAATEKITQERFFKDAKNVLLYYPKGNEVDTCSLIRFALSSGKSVFLPVIDVAESKLAVRELCRSEKNLVKGAFGIMNPKPESPIGSIEQMDLVILPAIAFDVCGNRLGRGGGYYDKFLRNVGIPKLGLAYSFQILDKVPVEKHDIKVDYIFTEDGKIECR